MADLVFVAIVLVFFAAAAGFVVLCDRIIGSDEAVAVPTLLRPAEPVPAKVA